MKRIYTYIVGIPSPNMKCNDFYPTPSNIRYLTAGSRYIHQNALQCLAGSSSTPGVSMTARAGEPRLCQHSAGCCSLLRASHPPISASAMAWRSARLSSRRPPRGSGRRGGKCREQCPRGIKVQPERILFHDLPAYICSTE